MRQKLGCLYGLEHSPTYRPNPPNLYKTIAATAAIFIPRGEQMLIDLILGAFLCAVVLLIWWMTYDAKETLKRLQLGDSKHSPGCCCDWGEQEEEALAKQALEDKFIDGEVSVGKD